MTWDDLLAETIARAEIFKGIGKTKVGGKYSTASLKNIKRCLRENRVAVHAAIDTGPAPHDMLNTHLALFEFTTVMEQALERSPRETTVSVKVADTMVEAALKFLETF